MVVDGSRALLLTCSGGRAIEDAADYIMTTTIKLTTGGTLTTETTNEGTRLRLDYCNPAISLALDLYRGQVDTLIAGLREGGSCRQDESTERVEVRDALNKAFGHNPTAYEQGKSNVELVRLLADCHRTVVAREKRGDALRREEMQKRCEL